MTCFGKVTDPEVARTIFLDRHRAFRHPDGSYRIEVLAVPGWFEPAEMEERLLRLVEER